MNGKTYSILSWCNMLGMAFYLIASIHSFYFYANASPLNFLIMFVVIASIAVPPSPIKFNIRAIVLTLAVFLGMFLGTTSITPLSELAQLVILCASVLFQAGILVYLRRLTITKFFSTPTHASTPQVRNASSSSQTRANVLPTPPQLNLGDIVYLPQKKGDPLKATVHYIDHYTGMVHLTDKAGNEHTYSQEKVRRYKASKK